MDKTHSLMIAVGLIILISYLSGLSDAAILTVNASGGADYAKIQDAIYNASNGDTITVAAGTYNENVDVNKSVSLIGAGAEVTIVNASNPNDKVVSIRADNVNIFGFTVTNSTSGWGGIYLTRSSYANISNNTIKYTSIGIRDDGVNNTIMKNRIYNNSKGIYSEGYYTKIIENNVSNNDYGLSIHFGSKNNITQNIVSNNNQYGIDIWTSNNTITSNIVTDNTVGITIALASNNILHNNTIYGNYYNFNFQGSYPFNNNIDTSNIVDGKPIFYIENSVDTIYDSSIDAGTVYCIFCNNVTIKDLTLTKNGDGIFFYGVQNSKIENITVMNNGDGINLIDSSNNNLTGNIISNNTEGIRLFNSSNNSLLDNIAKDNYNAIEIFSSSNNITIKRNIVSNSDFIGIRIFNSDNNTIASNRVSSGFFGPVKYGIRFEHSNNNTIYDNYFDNPENFIFDSPSNNSWNITKTFGINIVGGPYIGGNFWLGKWANFSWNCTDADRDGICDSLYILEANNTDFMPLAAPKVHNINKSTDYFTIQAAINDANIDDEIHVDSGTYPENVNVNKQLILKGVDIGGGKPVVDGGGGIAILITTDWATLNGFRVVNFSEGIKVTSSSSNNITDNFIFINGGSDGIRLDNSSENNISHNTINSDSSCCYDDMGIWLVYFSSNNTIIENNINNTFHGIYLHTDSNNNIILGNKVNNSKWSAFLLYESNNNTFKENIAETNQVAVLFDNYGENGTYDNLFFNNYFNNSYDIQKAINRNDNNSWNITKKVGHNIVGGLSLGGNFWANPSGTGFSQTCADANKDGICDMNYTIASENIDYLPLSAIPSGYGYIRGTVLNGTGIPDSLVTTNTSNSTTSDASGYYSLLVPAGQYNLTVTKEPEYYPNTSVIVTSTSGTTVTQDIELLRKQTGNITGSVTN